MDEVFWSNVVKRWSEASEAVIKLKKELAKVEEERNTYRDVVRNLHKSEGRSASQSRHISRGERGPSHGFWDDEEATLNATVKDELQVAEIGFGRAKEEYRRLQKELAESVEKVKALTLENEQLALRHHQEIGHFFKEHQEIHAVQGQLVDVRSENRVLQEKIQTLEKEMTQLRLNEQSAAELTPRPPFVRSLERRVKSLQELVETQETDREELLGEIAALRDKLQRAEENNKVLLSSIVRLQEIARHSMLGALHPLSNLQTGSPKPPRAMSIASSTRSRKFESPELHKVKSSMHITSVIPTKVEDVTFIRRAAPSPQLLPCLLPPEREKEIAKLPVIRKIINIEDDNWFDREFLKVALGDGIQSLVRRLADDPTSADRKATIGSYLCPTLNHHPWCPSVPGQHGFIFVGLGKEKESYKSPAIRNLFVGLPKTHAKHRKFRYLGRYRVTRVRSLTVDEWDTLSEDVKVMYAKLTKDKTRDLRSVEDITDAYNNGDLHVPCVQLQCMSFDEQLYAALISHRDSDPKA
ncbi:unnamed protein product [Cyclocybe aegerita]|uniref:DUF6697 domain-containing protein n=1 Tax=Cyclocybe aegerita TaxID=1973307 RepID=A0A8S0WV98_CYCAE|nr:unnamed protein product [Cyclocybe aegerita]